MKITQKTQHLNILAPLNERNSKLVLVCQMLASLIELQENPRNFNLTEITTNQVEKMVPLSG